MQLLLPQEEEKNHNSTTTHFMTTLSPSPSRAQVHSPVQSELRGLAISSKAVGTSGSWDSRGCKHLGKASHSYEWPQATFGAIFIIEKINVGSPVRAARAAAVPKALLRLCKRGYSCSEKRRCTGKSLWCGHEQRAAGVTFMEKKILQFLFYLINDSQL